MGTCPPARKGAHALARRVRALDAGRFVVVSPQFGAGRRSGRRAGRRPAKHPPDDSSAVDDPLRFGPAEHPSTNHGAYDCSTASDRTASDGAACIAPRQR